LRPPPISAALERIDHRLGTRWRHREHRAAALCGGTG
jgi:hypothetical protein